MDSQDSSSDKISNLPSIIIENILCLVPIKEAVRTSILSKDWRYSWTKIPKLVFSENNMLDKTIDVFFDAIHQVLSLHRGPIIEFSLSMTRSVDDECAELDQIISHLARNYDTVKKFTLHMSESHKFKHKLPLSIFSLHQLTDLYISGCMFHDYSTLSGFGNLKSLYLQDENFPKDALLHFLSNCPLLKHFELAPAFEWFEEEEIPIIELSKCLPVIEHLTICPWNIECDSVLGKLPTAFIHLKYFCIKEMLFFDDEGLQHLGYVIKNSPNLEKIKLEIVEDPFSVIECVKKVVTLKDYTLKDCSDIWLEHLKELEIVGFACQVAEIEFVKLILARSPVLMKVKMILNKKITTDEELKFKRILSGSPCVSPLAEMIVERQSIATSCYLDG